MPHHLRPRVLTPSRAADLAGSFDEHEAEERIEKICLGPIADGTRSLSELAAELHSFAEFLRDLESDGWQLIEPVGDAHALLINEDPDERLFEPELNEA